MKCLIPLCFTFLFICTIPNSFAADDPVPVLDSSGEPLIFGSRYYVVSAIWGAGGGVRLSYYSSPQCRITVVQSRWYRDYGIPVIFNPVGDAEESVIDLDETVQLEFDISLPCANSTVWEVGKLDAWARSIMIQIGGDKGSCARSCFKIQKGFFPSSYQLVYVSAQGNGLVGVTSSITGERLVILTSQGQLFNVVFIKADSSNGHLAI